MKQTKKMDFLHQKRSDYNREAGNKTLILVSALIFCVVLLSIATILMV